LQVTGGCKKAIGWTLVDIPGINPSICMHIILIDEEVKLMRQFQHMFNPLILDVKKRSHHVTTSWYCISYIWQHLH